MVHHYQGVDGGAADILSVSKVEMFQCAKENKMISYTLVCDFRSHCADASDENFCVHPTRFGGFS